MGIFFLGTWWGGIPLPCFPSGVLLEGEIKFFVELKQGSDFIQV